ncbi:MAG: hypothetical protein K9W44_07655 [Candidatus Lokiarchaeota archaeon]|nr:hypothetical protein [Candidatus Harpocratesius repetitus]
MNSKEIIEIVSNDQTVQKLFELDPESELFIHKIQGKSLLFLQNHFPELFSPNNTCIWSINFISHKMIKEHAYAYGKIKFFLSNEGKILKKIKNL